MSLSEIESKARDYAQTVTWRTSRLVINATDLLDQLRAALIDRNDKDCAARARDLATIALALAYRIEGK